MSIFGTPSVYYLFYSANRYNSADYAVGYGVCQSTSGPCQKATLDEADGGSPAVLQSAPPALGPGGEEFFHDDQGVLWSSTTRGRRPRRATPAAARGRCASTG